MNFFKSTLLGTLMLAGCAFGNACATVIDFEHPDAYGIPGGTNYDNIPINTQGFSFSSNADVVDVTDGVASGEGPAHSGSFVALNDFGGAISMRATDGGLFSLQDFWIHGAYGSAEVGSVSGYVNGVLLGAILFSTTTDWQNIVANFSQVDQILIDAGGNFLVDDLNATISAVPEPASLALLGLGLAGLAGAMRRWQT